MSRLLRPGADGGRWEYLLGGMFGLVLGFIVHMSTGDRSQDEILDEGWFACVRCVIWLAAFVLFDFLPWTQRVRVAALTIGVAALSAGVMRRPGAGLPAVTVALWAAVALALNALPQPDLRRRQPPGAYAHPAGLRDGGDCASLPPQCL